MSSTSDNPLTGMQPDEVLTCKLEVEGDLSGRKVKKLEEEFTEALTAMTYKKVILSFTSANNIDSPGLALCIGLYKECQKKNLEFEIVANQEIFRIFKIVNLDRVLPIKESIDARK